MGQPSFSFQGRIVHPEPSHNRLIFAPDRNWHKELRQDWQNWPFDPPDLLTGTTMIPDDYNLNLTGMPTSDAESIADSDWELNWGFRYWETETPLLQPPDVAAF